MALAVAWFIMNSSNLSMRDSNVRESGMADDTDGNSLAAALASATTCGCATRRAGQPRAALVGMTGD